MKERAYCNVGFVIDIWFWIVLSACLDIPYFWYEEAYFRETFTKITKLQGLAHYV